MAIHDQKYLRYEGTLRLNTAWWVIAATHLRVFWGFLRTKLMTLFLWGVPVIIAILLLGEYMFRAQVQLDPEPSLPTVTGLATYMQLQVFSVAMLYMASGCGIISNDMQYRTFQLYFSKPMNRWEYILGKFLAVFSLGALVSIIPTILLGGLRTALFWQDPHFEFIAAVAGKSILVSCFALIIMSCLIMGLSSLTRRTGYVVLALIATLFIPIIIQGIYAIATESTATSNLMSISGNISLIADIAWGDKPENIPTFAPFAILLTLAGAALATVITRVHKLEGTA